MNPEEKSLLEHTHKLVEENNELLLSMRRRARMGTVLKIFYWTVIIGLSFGAFYFIQPYVEFIKGAGSNNASNTSENSKSNLNNFSQNLQDLLK